MYGMCGPDGDHPPRPNTHLLPVTSLIVAAIEASSSIRTGPEQRPCSSTSCNPIQGHETLTFDPTCDTSDSVVPQVSSKRANRIPSLLCSSTPVAC